jgi:outer membrane PBP1 activator LpoA protein
MRMKNLGAHMLLQMLTVLLATSMAGGPAHAGAVCAGPERLCASTHANTSARPSSAPLAFVRDDGVTLAAAAAVTVVVGADPEIQPKRPAAAHPLATQPLEPGLPAVPAHSGTAVTRIALLLPLRSATLAAAADAVRAGFMAGAERDGAGFKVEIVSTGDTAADVLDAYARAAAASDIVVGPLSRSAATALAGSAGVNKPTILLSAPDTRNPLPRLLLVAGLSVEDEARQVADWAAREHPHGRALVLTGDAAWAQRAAGAFEARWSQLGHTGGRMALPAAGDPTAQAAIGELKQRLDIDPPDLLFAALDASQLDVVRRRLDAAGVPAIPCYGGGAANPGRQASGAAALDGLRVLDLPWIVAPDHPAVMPYPRPPNPEQPLDMDRLYALGIDAFRVARAMTLHPDAPFAIDGVTGRLSVSIDAETRQLRLERREAAATVRDGGFERVDGGP